MGSVNTRERDVTFFFNFKDIVLIENEGDVVETLTLLVFRCEGIGWRRLSH